jgi:hypothetical protein
MTRDNIIKLAVKVGWAQKDIDSLLYIVETAAAAEREACEIETLRADAARYRWLRDEDDDPICSLRQLFTMTGKPKDVDAAVDAAMRKAVTP